MIEIDLLVSLNDNENNSHLGVDRRLRTTLADLKAGDKAKILGFNSGSDAYRQKLLALGLVPNTEFSVVRVAPLGDPIEIRIHNFSLCLRKQEGSILQLERLVGPLK